ncbi:glycosyl transferase family 9 [Dissulfurispira thermophila]|uniref:Glycosyl transferase family 9 n=1 Tax=Dissulfurispira thermophila TaxID=2715679 RepID=A0A7G1H3B0_9BACT|nr:glycosyltransferase family 9 protein [Dissulfurispira thermophila]BCB97295.1 glycosyl transferase family 9 [Dissulfurispira thermophila]
MNRFFHRLLDFTIRKYIKRHPDQIKKIEKLNFEPKRFLVISSTAMGDTILSTPAIKSLRKSFPKTKITVLMNKNIAPLFKNFRYINNIILYHGGYKKFFKTVAEIRKERPDVVLIFHGNGPQDIAFAVFSGASVILKHPTKSLYRKYLSFDFKQKYQHTIEDRLDLIRKIGGTIIDKTMEIPPLNDKIKEDKVKNYLNNDGNNLIGFQIGASHFYNMWPIENFIELAKRILSLDSDTRIVVTGIKKEYALGEKIVKSCGKKVINCCGKFRIDELPYLIKRFKLLITGDTGPMHLAIAINVPTISLFSAADSKITGAYQDHQIHRIIQKNGRFIAGLPKKKRDDSAMRLITVEEVFSQYEDFMHNRPI